MRVLLVSPRAENLHWIAEPDPGANASTAARGHSSRRTPMAILASALGLVEAWFVRAQRLGRRVRIKSVPPARALLFGCLQRERMSASRSRRPREENQEASMSRICGAAPAAVITMLSVSLFGAPVAMAAPTASVSYEPAENTSHQVEAPAAHDAPATLFGPGNAHQLGGFGALETGYTRMAGRDLFLGCIEGAFILDHALTLGVAGCGVGPRINADGYGDVIHEPGDRLQVGYGGFAVRYHFLSREMLHFSVGALVGGGAIAITNPDTVWTNRDDHAKTTDAFFAIEPRVTGYLNLTRWARVGAFAGYRVAGGVGMTNLSSADIGGPTLGATFQFGWF